MCLSGVYVIWSYMVRHTSIYLSYKHDGVACHTESLSQANDAVQGLPCCWMVMICILILQAITAEHESINLFFFIFSIDSLLLLHT